ncbi:hypothetical protein J3R30DRAFT_705150 [Lentinula aciculospora]|uniref:Uncharacterized protein n=1 Tax=Lentinula aciculospora TaxID=153920 RepID=A0A9W9A3Y3_9AGAR|nr:hypothetical protein J3R30DRAFT_705150 [Lentinula aciculospora]
MDDPWANAWDESHIKNSNLPAPTKSLFATSTWKDPTENETDIALPSWSAGPAVTWNEPSDDAPTLWSASASNDTIEPNVTPTFSPKVAGWTSSYESISAHFGSSSVDGNSEIEQDEETGEVVEEKNHDSDEEKHQVAAENNETPEVVDAWTPSQSTFPTSTSINSILVESASHSPQAPGTPDAFEFGTFESGASDSTAELSTEGETWDSSTGSLANPDSEWGSAWASKEADKKDEEDEEVLDEWERARREKEKMDRVVPPKFLASILHTLDEISDDLWPPIVQANPNPNVTAKVPTAALPQESSKSAVEEEIITQRSDSAGEEEVLERTITPKPTEVEHEASTLGAEIQPEDPFSHWKGGIDAVEGLSELCQTIIPPLPPLSSLPSIPSQSNSQSPISKRSSEALRLTRSTMISSSGPLGIYLKTKGSIEWEVAVKARPEKTSEQEREEIVPAGWRILPKEKEDEKKAEAPEMKRKGSSILSSFFGRKTETPPMDNKDTKEASPRPSVASSRNSVDTSVGKSSTANVETSKLSTNPVSSPVPSTSATALAGITPTSSTYGDGGSPDLFQDVPATAPAPSAVSRFLNRFSSRSRPSHSRQNSNSSLALSTDDLEFLQDIVPSANDVDHDHDNHELVATGKKELDLVDLHKMINSAPLPAPLLPPPRAPQQSQSQSGSPQSPSDDFIINPSVASRHNSNFNSSQIWTPSPALPSQIQTTIGQNSRSSTPSSFSSPLSARSSSPGLDMLAIAGSSAAGGRASQVTGTGMNALGGTSGLRISRPPSSALLNTRASSSSTTMKRHTPMAIMSSSSASSSKTPDSVNSFNFLPPPPSIHAGGKATSSSTPSLLIDDDEPTRVPSSTPPVLTVSVPPPPPESLDDDDFSDFLSATTPDAAQPPFTASEHLFSLSSAQPLFSAGSNAFNGFDSSGPSDPPPAPYNDPLNTSVSSVASANSINNVLLSSGETDSFGDFPDVFNQFMSSSPASRDTLRTPSPPALPAKSPGKLAARIAFGTEPSSNSGVTRRASTGKKTMGGSGIGGRIPPGRLNLPPPVSSSAYSRKWGSAAHEPSPSIPSGNSVNSASPFVASSSEPALASTTNSSLAPKTHQKRVSKEAHQRTRSLVEDAMARSGIWPSTAASAASSTGGYGSESGSAYGAYGFGTAPPLSPLPPILSPPPESSSSRNKRRRGEDLLGGHDDDDDDVPLASLASGSTYGSAPTASSIGSAFAAQQTKGLMPPMSSMSSLTLSPALMPSLYSESGSDANRNGILPPIPLPGPAPSSQQSTLPMAFGAFGSGSSSSPATGRSSMPPPLLSAFDTASASSTSKKTTGGLSAQDLSFFEGL